MMRKISIVGATALSVVFCAGEVQAQTAPAAPPPLTPQSARRSQPDFKSQYNINRVFNQELAGYSLSLEIASCVVRGNKSRAGTLVGGPLTGDPKYTRLTSDLRGRYQNCNPDNQPVATALISSAIAEKLVLATGNGGLADHAMAVEADKAATFMGGSMEGGVTLEKLGRCLAIYSPGLAYKVLASEPGKEAEEAALNALFAQTPDCGITQRPKEVSATQLRTAIADGLFHWMQDAK